MKKQYIYIKPLDTLFFRGGKPFGKGEESWIDPSMMIPYPSVVWGALFSRLLADKEDKVVTAEDKKSLEVKNIYLYHHEDKRVLIPAPLDLFLNKKGSHHFYPETYQDAPISSHQLETVVMPENPAIHAISAENKLISLDDFCTSYYRRGTYQTVIYEIDDIVKLAPKTSIARNNQTHTAEEGQFFKIEMAELDKQWGYLVEIKCDIDFGSGLIKLGGEGKVASYQKLASNIIPNMTNYFDNISKEDSYYKIYFQSPAFWDSGNGVKELLELKSKGIELVSAAIGKPQLIGGFDISTKSPKVARKAIPAGTTYLVYAENVDLATISSKIVDALPRHNVNGFGSFIVLPLIN